MIWGLHNGGWMSGLIAGAEDRLQAHLELLREYDLHATGERAEALLALDEAQRQEIAGLLGEYDIHLSLGVGFDYFSSDPNVIKQGTQSAIEAVEKLAPMMRTLFCFTGINRQYHHYSRDLPVEQQIEKLSQSLAPLAKACADMGCPLLIHTVTHFGADYAELCERVPGLGLLYDTANCFLIGEPPLQQAETCAPYTRAVHFKDHYVSPGFDPLGLQARGAVPGQGDVNLREVYRILAEKVPDPEHLVLELEIDPVHDENGQMRDRREVLLDALDFIHSL